MWSHSHGGSWRNESLWRVLRAIMPEKCSVTYGMALIKLSFFCYNLESEQQYNPKCAYIPISGMYECCTQYLTKYRPERMGDPNGVSSMFGHLPLGEGE